VAVAANVTVTGADQGGHLRFYPAGTERSGTSTINFGVAQTRANNAVLLLGEGGATAVFDNQPSGWVDLIVDVSGYFE
jgi:hypothetical protein